MVGFEKPKRPDNEVIPLRNPGMRTKKTDSLPPLPQSKRVPEGNPMKKGAELVVTVPASSENPQDKIHLGRRFNGKKIFQDQGFFLCRCLRSFFFRLCLFIFRLRCFLGQGTESLLFLGNDLV